MNNPAKVHESIQSAVSNVLVGNEEIIERFAIALLTGGHVLIEGVPGVAKTTMANLFARATGLEYSRIQMTSDVLPADITGTRIYREPTGNFAIQRGPVFANIVVVDEINRATPKTQSALLEAMQERHVTIEGKTLELPDPFMVIATQNPIEMEGTFELPEAQRDRFQLKLTVDIPPREDEQNLLDRFDATPQLGPELVEQAVPHEILHDARDDVANVHVDERVKQYILDIVAATRESPNVAHGGSPRASIALLNVSKAHAAIHDREYVIPDDVKSLARPVLAHRIVMSTDAILNDVSSISAVESALDSVDSPDNQVDLVDSSALSDGE